MKHNPKESPLKWALRVVQGVIIGGGAILPGISGGVLSVIFGLYEPMMTLFSRPRMGIKKYWRLFLPVCIGWAIGFVVFARFTAELFHLSQSVASWLFIGLIAGTLPSLFRQAASRGKSKYAPLSLAICFAVMLAVLLSVNFLSARQVDPDFFSFLFCGVLWGLSLIVPGMTSSSILMSVGLYEPMAEGIGSLSPGVIVPMLIGIILIAASLSRLVRYIFERRYCVAFYGIIGVVLASTAAIIPLSYASPLEIILSVAAAAVGFAAAYVMDKTLAK